MGKPSGGATVMVYSTSFRRAPYDTDVGIGAHPAQWRELCMQRSTASTPMRMSHSVTLQMEQGTNVRHQSPRPPVVASARLAEPELRGSLHQGEAYEREPRSALDTMYRHGSVCLDMRRQSRIRNMEIMSQPDLRINSVGIRHE